MVYLYLHTLRYLKLKQILFRILFLFFNHSVDTRKAPELKKNVGKFVSPASRRKSIIGQDLFFFLNQKKSLSDIGWNGNKVSKLWRYNQHYFDDLNANKSIQRQLWHVTLLEKWIVQNPPGSGIGWDPYPCSLRIVNWIKWHLLGNTLSYNCIQSLSIQVRWLSKHIEWHLLGNHLFANAKALVFAGVFFEGKEAKKWLKKGLKIISHEIHEQVLLDGGHFELSPMYHSIFLEDILDLFNLSKFSKNQIEPKTSKLWKEIADKMITWLKIMTHPDGEIAFFNDACVGISPKPLEIIRYAKRLAIFNNHSSKNSFNITKLSQSGYLRLKSAEACVFLDVAKIGPDYLPAHSHADTLSFEFSLHNQRIFVNGGTSDYGLSQVRLDERSTKSHNTVSINNQNSSEVWSSFRVAKRAYPKHLSIYECSDYFKITCSHDGFRRLPGKPQHTRHWCFKKNSLIIEDFVEGPFKEAYAFFHFHPNISVETQDSENNFLILFNGKKVNISIEFGKSLLKKSFYAPQFGRRLETQCLQVCLGSRHTRVSCKW